MQASKDDWERVFQQCKDMNVKIEDARRRKEESLRNISSLEQQIIKLHANVEKVFESELFYRLITYFFF